MKQFWATLFTFALAQTASAFDVGYNEAWFGQKYQTYLTKDFDFEQVNKTFKDLKSAGGDIVRLWIFQGRQGIVLAKYAPQTSKLEPMVVDNIAKIIGSAKAHNLKIYWTLLDGNSMPREKGEPRDYYYNLLNNKYGENDAFLRNAVTPILEILDKNQETTYALDIMNEIQAPMQNNFWPFSGDNTAGPRRWMKDTVSFIKQRSPWLKVTSSAGWGWGAKDLKNGMFSNLGLDFYDLHVYDDKGVISYAEDICRLARKENMTVLLGEFGQKSKGANDALHTSSTEKFLANAKKNCFTGALAWRFDAEEETWAYQRKDGTFRPAVKVMQRYRDASGK